MAEVFGQAWAPGWPSWERVQALARIRRQITVPLEAGVAGRAVRFQPGARWVRSVGQACWEARVESCARTQRLERLAARARRAAGKTILAKEVLAARQAKPAPRLERRRRARVAREVRGVKVACPVRYMNRPAAKRPVSMEPAVSSRHRGSPVGAPTQFYRSAPACAFVRSGLWTVNS